MTLCSQVLPYPHPVVAAVVAAAAAAGAAAAAAAAAATDSRDVHRCILLGPRVHQERASTEKEC